MSEQSRNGKDGVSRQVKPEVSRRTFLSTAAAVGVTAATASRVRAKGSGSGVLGANERLVMGIIGTGGMGRHHMPIFQAAGVDWAGVCDIYSPNLAEGMKLAGDKAKAYHEHERLLDNKDIQAVLIASPEHWHHDHLIDAMKAGKDVYSEKPMCHTIEQGAEMIKAVRATDRIVQIGMQRRSSPIIQEMKKIFEEKALGDIHLVRAEWYWNWAVDTNPELPGKLDWERFCGPAGKQEYEAIKFRHWRLYWPFSGGNEADQGTHLMDVVQWMMDAKQPLSAVQAGEVYRSKPTETPDTFCCAFDFPDFLATWTLCYTNNTWHNDWSICFQGTKASLFLTENGYFVLNQVNNWTTQLPKPIKQNLAGGVTDTTPHTKNFLECVKTRKEPNAPVEIGHRAVRPLHLANAALKSGRKAILEEDGVTIRLQGA